MSGRFYRGQHVSHKDLNRLDDGIRRTTPAIDELSEPEVYPGGMLQGVRDRPTGGAARFEPFEIYDERPYGFKIRGGPVNNSILPIRGVPKDIGPGASGVDLDTFIAFTESAYIHVKLATTESAETATLERLTTWPNATDSGTPTWTVYYPIYYVKFVSPRITEIWPMWKIIRDDRTG